MSAPIVDIYICIMYNVDVFYNFIWSFIHIAFIDSDDAWKSFDFDLININICCTSIKSTKTEFLKFIILLIAVFKGQLKWFKATSNNACIEYKWRIYEIKAVIHSNPHGYAGNEVRWICILDVKPSKAWWKTKR